MTVILSEREVLAACSRELGRIVSPEVPGAFKVRFEQYGHDVVAEFVPEGLALAGPVEVVALARPFHDRRGEFLTKLIEVHSPCERAVFAARLRDAIGEDGGDLLDVLGGQVWGVEFEFIHDYGS